MTIENHQTGPIPRNSFQPKPSDLSFKLTASKLFPFQSWSHLPTLTYAWNNVVYSTFSVVGAVSSLILTAGIFLPLGFVKSIADTFAGFVTKSSSATGQKRVYVISGATSGIGAGVAQEYAGDGVVLVLIGRDQGRLDEVSKAAQEKGAKMETHTMELREADTDSKVIELMNSIHERHGRVDIVFTIAGALAHLPDTMQDEPWGQGTAERMTQVNVNAAVAFIFLPGRSCKRKNMISIIASSAAFFAPANFCIYGATKSYLLTLGLCLRSLGKTHNIKVNVICPGFIKINDIDLPSLHQSGMTGSMKNAGSSLPWFAFQTPEVMAYRIRYALETDEGCTPWPLNQCLPLIAAQSVNPIMDEVGRWAGAQSYITSELMS
ncbi:hypothetical protein BZG36_05594 [Bifiguratus adelaidae]|uniref:NAD(P)-binding protein n=1 Tax=Bifiguratus adelaidae TaxID=1938954 RepID=A0A261XSU1_9FUNG|nr:hypothetical protein BZG36_05594 [Bifiguratus adelaidae]